jgi:16S rRNA (cytosine967-C5)-methyltransferase
VSGVQPQAVRALLQTFGGRSLSAVLPQSRGRLTDGGDRAAVQDIAFGVLRHLGLLRAALNALLERPLPDPEVEALLLVGLYQLQFTRTPAHAVVDQAVENCAALRKHSARSLVNAVLRNFLRKRDEVLAAAHSTEAGRWSHPQWWIDQLKIAYPQDYELILDAANRHPPMTLRVNARRIETDAYLSRLTEQGMSAEKIGSAALMLQQPVPVTKLPGFGEGLVSVQDLSAQLAATLLDLQAGQHVLDACAAPGGKTAHILEMAEVRLTAVDVDAQRLKLVAETLERLQLPPARLIAADAANLGAWWDGVPFDRILLDAPCTASGIVRRHPDIKWLRRPGDVPQLAAQQSQLLRALWHALKPGGKLLYATCSVFPEETRQQITDFLQAQPDARRVKLSGIPEAGDVEGQIVPSARHDGFFFALLQKD